MRSLVKLPSHVGVLTVSSNKKQLIVYILAYAVAHKDMLNGKHVTTDNCPVPIQIIVNHGVVSRRYDMIITHEEADTMFIRQMASVCDVNILVVAA